MRRYTNGKRKRGDRMQLKASTVQANRAVITYIIIAIVLLAALLLGVRWAKNQANYYAQHPAGHTTTADNSGNKQQSGTSTQPSQSQPAPSPSSSSNSSGQTNSAPAASSQQTATNTPARVPSTGPEQFVLPIVSLCIFMFAFASYARARRRLQTVTE